MVMNMTILLALGRFTADRYGAGAILPVFFVGAVGGGAVFGLLAGGAYPMVGASGAVFAFLGLWIAWDWRRHRGAGLSTAPVLRRVAGAGGPERGDLRRAQGACSPGRRTSAAFSPGSPAAAGWRAAGRGAPAPSAPRRAGGGRGRRGSSGGPLGQKTLVR